jgi:hypothetical protein
MYAFLSRPFVACLYSTAHDFASRPSTLPQSFFPQMSSFILTGFSCSPSRASLRRVCWRDVRSFGSASVGYIDVSVTVISGSYRMLYLVLELGSTGVDEPDSRLSSVSDLTCLPPIHLVLSISRPRAHSMLPMNISY